MNLDQLLTDAARQVADQVDPPEVDLEAVRNRAARAGRRRTTALAVAAAAVTAALVGIPLLADHDSSTAPQPAAPPTSQIVWSLNNTNCAMDQCLKPRTYGIPLGRDSSGHRLRATLTVQSGGWEAQGDLHRISRANAEGTVVLSVYQPSEFAGPGQCVQGMRRVAPDAAMDDVVPLLSTLPQFAVVDGPRAVPAFGRDTRYVKLRTDRISCPAVAGAQYNLAEFYGMEGEVPRGEANLDPGQPVLIEFWVLVLEGKPIVVEARQEGTPDDAMIRGLDQLRESLTFGFRGP